MNRSMAIATGLVVGAGAAGASAFNVPVDNYQGSDTLFTLTQAAMNACGMPGSSYIGGGSGNGQAAMAADPPTQQAAPMSRMPNNGNDVCQFPAGSGDAGSGDDNASSLVVALDAVDIMSSIATGASGGCSGGVAEAGAGTGLVYSGGVLGEQTVADGGAYKGETWKDVLALVYGGKNNATGVVDCNQAERINLVANWSNLFQNACANAFSAGTMSCSDTNHSSGTSVVVGTAPLWHAFRRDDASGTSDLLATVLGLSPSVSTSAVNGFGTSPYCNALNWDTTSNGSGTCLLKTTGKYDPHMQYIGPGGVPDLTSDSSGKHRQPPSGLNGAQVWGSGPPTFLYKGSDIAFDVLPTSFQDNDPIRRPCIGSSLTKAGEQVCNIDGSLGLVLPFAESDWILKVEDPLHSGSTLQQYPAHTCDGSFIAGAPPNVFHCAPANVTHGGECQNGDAPNGGLCQYPVDKLDGFGQCNAKSTTVSFFSVRNVSIADGRAFNLWLTNGTLTDGAAVFAQYPLPALNSSADMGGAFSRLHSLQPAFTGLNSCQLVSMDDTVGCNAQADPCSIGYSGDDAKSWNARASVANPNVDAIDVFKIYPQTSTVQLLGLAGEYPIARKLYYGSLTGWSNVTLQELTLAEYETGNLTETTTFNSLVGPAGFFAIGAQSPGGNNAQFCEDFDEQTICGASSNTNGCLTNPADEVPTVNTVCGNGTLEAFEECDDGANNGAAGDPCTNTCRCVGAFPCSPSITCSTTSADTACRGVAVDTACVSNAGVAGECAITARPNTCVCQP